MIQAEMARQHERHRRRDAEQGQVFAAEQLDGQHQGGQRRVGHAAEHAHQTQSRTQGSGQAQQRSRYTAQGGAHEERGHDLAALVAGAQGDGGKQQLQREGLRLGMACQRLHDGVSAAAVIIPAAHQQRQGDHCQAAHRHADEIIGQPPAHPLACGVHHHAEQDRHHREHHAQSGGLERRQRIHLRQPRCQREHLRRCADPFCHQRGRHRRCHAGQQASGIEPAHLDDLQHEHRRRHRCAEQRRKQRRHAAQLTDAPHILPAVGVGDTAHRRADAAAQLQRRALPARRAAQQMGQRGGQEDGRSHQNRHPLLRAHRLDDLIRADTQRQPHQPVQSGDGKAAHRQQVHKPRVSPAGMGRPFHRHGESTAGKAAQAADERGGEQPDNETGYIVPHRGEGLFQGHGSGIFFRLGWGSASIISPVGGISTIIDHQPIYGFSGRMAGICCVA